MIIDKLCEKTPNTLYIWMNSNNVLVYISKLCTPLEIKKDFSYFIQQGIDYFPVEMATSDQINKIDDFYYLLTLLKRYKHWRIE